MDGLTATRKIREWEKAEQRSFQTPIIAMTAYALEEDMKKSLIAGCSEHLSKPVNKKSFTEMLVKYLGDIGIKEIPQANTSKHEASRSCDEKEGIVIHTDPALKDLIPDFLKELRQKSLLLRKYLKEEEFEKIQSIGHRMKGEGGTYGFNVVTDLGAGIHKAAIEKDSLKIRHLSEALSRYLDRVILK
jgi:CheY-like chemotaxis protein